MKHAMLIISMLFVFSACSIHEQSDVLTKSMEGIKADFLNPPAETRPGCYWYWLNDNISKEGITKDLEAMSRVGIGRAYIGHIYNHKPESERGPGDERYMTPLGDVKFMSDEWWEAVQWAVREADRCNVEIGFFNSPGWSQSGGPWMKASQSMRYLTHSETVITGGREVNQIIPVPEVTTYPMAGGSRPTQTGPEFTEKDFQDVRIIAFGQPETEADDIDMKEVTVTSGSIKEVENLFDGSTETYATFNGSKDLIIDLTLPETIGEKSGIQSINIKPLDTRYTLKCRIESSGDGKTYQQIGDYSEQRGHQGAKKKDAILIPFRETRERYLRLIFNVNNAVKFAEMSISRSAVVGGYVRKQLGETDPSTNPGWDAYVWPEQGESAVGSAVISGDVVDLSDRMDTDGRLKWDAPTGNWVVLRMGMIPIGAQNAPSSPESRGLEVDKMNREHVESLFDGMVGEFLRRTPVEDRKALKYIIADSYETGPQNWTDGFAEKFEARFGYSPGRFMPVLTGRVVDSPDVSERFLWDMRRLIVEGITYDYVGGLREVCNKNDLTLWLENYGHWGFPSEFLLYGSQSNQVGGEFWIGGVRGNIECRAAVSCAHIYGKKSVYAESFTSGDNFSDSPASIKKWCDWVYGVGVNHLILHVYIHQPDERKPGIIQWFGTDFNRHNTWFEQSKGFIDYTRRSSVLLKAGFPVIDVAYYIGENAPMMQGPRDPELPDGYEFDFINSDVLINRTSVEDGKIVVKDGPCYAVLVLPRQKVMRPEVAEAIKRLVGQGATIICPKPVVSPSLENYPVCDETLRKIAGEVWGDLDGKAIKMHKYGKGYVYDGLSLEDVLTQNGIEQDVRVISEGELRCASAGSDKIGIGRNGGIVFNHRTGKKTDIYFLANTSNEAVDFTVSLRCAGRKPSLWNAVTGKISEAAAFTQEEGRTLIPLHLDASESIFVVFDGEISNSAKGLAKSNRPDYTTLATLDGKWIVRFEGQNAPGEIVFDTLMDWSKHTNPAIRYYAGTAVYEKSFTLEKPSSGNPVILELGEVGVIASVFVNGKEAGTVWTTPWEIDISNFAVSGKNDLQIRVANTWNNRVFADSKLPEEERLTYISQPYQFKADAPLLKGGLLGRVKIKQQK